MARADGTHSLPGGLGHLFKLYARKNIQGSNIIIPGVSSRVFGGLMSTGIIAISISIKRSSS